MEGQRRLFEVVLRRVDLKIVLVVVPSRKLSLRVWLLVSVGLCLVLLVGGSVAVHIDPLLLLPLDPRPYLLYYPLALLVVPQPPPPVQKYYLRNLPRSRLQKVPPHDPPPLRQSTLHLLPLVLVPLVFAVFAVLSLSV